MSFEALPTSQNNLHPSDEEMIDIRKLLFLLWHWAWLIILAAVLAGGTAFYISKQMTPIYATTTELLVIEGSSERSADYQDVLTSERLTRTYSDLLTNQDILQEVIDLLLLHLETEVRKEIIKPKKEMTEVLEEMIEVTPIRDTQLIAVTVEGENPSLIAEIANTIVRVFSDRISAIQAERYSESIESLSAQMKDIEEVLQDIQSQIEILEITAAAQTPEVEIGTVQPYNPEKENLEAQVVQYQQIYAELLTGYEQTRLAETQSSANIIQVNEALPPLEPIKPNLLINTLIAAVVAVMLSTGFVFVVNSLNDTIETPEQVESVLGLSVLGVIFEHKNNSGVISQDQPHSPISEAFRSLRTNVQSFNIGEELKTLLVTSPSIGSGKSLISSNLAVILAQSGKHIILADVDLRRPSLHKNMNLSNDTGITSVLLNPKRSLDKLFNKTTTENLTVITSGDLPPNPSELLGSHRMSQLIEELKQKADMVIFDAPPVLPVADAVVISALVDGVLLVLEPGKTTIAAARQTVKSLRRVNAQIIGVVFNNVQLKGSLYNYYYRKGYGHYQSDYFSDMK